MFEQLSGSWSTNPGKNKYVVCSKELSNDSEGTPKHINGSDICQANSAWSPVSPDLFVYLFVYLRYALAQEQVLSGTTDRIPYLKYSGENSGLCHK